MARRNRSITMKAVAAALLTALAGSRALAAEVVCPNPTGPAQVAAVVDDLDLALEDGRTLRLAGLDPARATPGHPGLGEQIRAALAARLVGREVTVAVLASEPDRWDRLPAIVALPFPATGASSELPPSLNERLIAEGQARVRPEPSVRPCVARFMALEGKARDAGIGLWSDPAYAVVAATDRRSLGERTGAMALVEGRAGGRQIRGRLDLLLGPRHHGLTATIRGSALKDFARAGIDPKNLIGLRLRVRGFLDDRFGPRIDLTEAGQIEILDDPLQPRRPAEGRPEIAGPPPFGAGTGVDRDANAEATWR